MSDPIRYLASHYRASSRSLPERTDVELSKATEDCVSWCGWHGMQEVSRDRCSPWLAGSTSLGPCYFGLRHERRTHSSWSARPVIESAEHVD